jgi:epoxyqueuosine reductase
MITVSQLERIVRQSGLTAVGVSSPVLNHKYAARFQTWLKNKLNAEMYWMAKDPVGRIDIRKRFPWVKAVIVVLDKYHTDTCFDRNPKIARYAMSKDYHLVVTEKLQKTLDALKAVDNRMFGKIFVDTGAILEKAYAEQAGLGWIGKNGLLIAENIGSFCFIGVLLVNREFPLSEKVPNKCGSCNLCMERCPTGAIIKPGLIDTRKCISYLTVEKRGAFSKSQNYLIGSWLFGCDVCQDVCPYNLKRTVETAEEEMLDSRERFSMPLEEWGRMCEGAFTRLFDETPLKRLKYEQFKRNVAAVRLAFNDR